MSNYALFYSFILNFAYAEALEDTKNFEEVHNTFKKFLEILRQNLETIEANEALKEANTSINPDSSQPNDLDNSFPLSQQTNTSSSQGSSSGGKNKDLNDRRTEYGIAWIVYMRFARRAESLSAARSVFTRARKDKWTPWEVYEAAGTRHILSFILESGRTNSMMMSSSFLLSL